MKKKFFCFAIAFVVLAMMACGNKTAANAEGKDSVTAVEEQSEVKAGDEKTEEDADKESTESSPTDNEDWDVSVRMFDLDSNPGYEVIIRNNEGKVLTVGEQRGFDYPEDMLKTFGEVWQTDINFDGYKDVMICLGQEPVSDQTFVRYDAWVYHPDDGKFYCPETFRDICNPEVDPEEKRILSHYIARDGETRVYSAHYWQKDGNIQHVGKSWEVKR
jgi:hypothetical protein